jgi:ComF family protein
MRLKFKQPLNHDVSNKLFDRLFKQRCLICSAKDGGELGLCSAFYKDLPWHTTQYCPPRGLSSNGLICVSCLNSQPDFDATKSLFIYDFPLDTMMQRYKYGSMLNLVYVFGKMLSYKSKLAEIDLFIPMPLHPNRLRERGYNQALEIAKVITKNQPDKLGCAATQRQSYTPPQASIPLRERIKNINGAFKIYSHSIEYIKDKRIAIVDDVMTTGTSLNELAKTLKQAGACNVECWVIARTLPRLNN